MICSKLFNATTLAAVFMISITAGAQTIGAPKQQAPVPGSTVTEASADGRDFSLQLAQAKLAKESIMDPTQNQINSARSSIQARRSQGEGWGIIAHSLGLNFGKVVGASNHHRKYSKHSEKGERKITRDAFAAVSHQTAEGAGGSAKHGEHSGHDSGSGGGSSQGK